MSWGNEYGAGQIQILRGLEAVQKRPAMCIGSTDSHGLHHLAYRVVDNSIDETLTDHCDVIEAALHEDGSVSVINNGRGIPVDMHKQYDQPALEVIMTVLHAGGKFDNESYQASGGLRGIGVSVVNALSGELGVEVERDNAVWTHRPEMDESQVEEFEHVRDLEPGEDTETTIRFWPDGGIFGTTEFDFKTLENRLRELALLNSGVEIPLSDRRTDESDTFLFEGGIREFVEYLDETKTALHDDVIYYGNESEGIEVEIAMQATGELQGSIYAFANNINTREGGTHLTGFKTTLARVVNDYANTHDILDDLGSNNLRGEDVHEGLTAVISIKHPDPRFEDQTKTKLGNSEVHGIVGSITHQQLETFFGENPDAVAAIISKAAEAACARKAAKQAEELTHRKSALGSASLLGKLVDCQSRDPIESELFIVEGDSAGGSARRGRDRRFQAILPLKGKILNAGKRHLDRILENDEIRALIIAIGGDVGDEFDIEEARYQRLILMTDADVNGAYIWALLLTLLYRHMCPLIEAGYVYATQPPLYRVRYRGNIYDVMDRVERDRIIEEECNGNPTQVQRFKGLGEMNLDQLWDAMMNPENHILKRITVKGAAAADRMFDILMGDAVGPRKQFIRDHANDAEWVDI